jgi:nitrogen regulatory protein P-II 1
MNLLVMVLDDSTQLNQVMMAWRESDVKGITVLESTGMNRILPRHSPQPMFTGFSNLFGGGRVGHYTIFAVVESMTIAEKAVKATEETLGDLSQPHTGIIFAVPVNKVWGMPEPYLDDGG